MTLRDTQIQSDYQAYLAELGDACPFCRLRDNATEQIIDETDHCLVVHAKFPYERWDSHSVDDHLMIVPIHHYAAVHEFDDKVSADFMTLVKLYESRGYSIYARAANNPSKTIRHQHTHLIKIS